MGRPSQIALEPNNFNVSNYLQVAYYNRDFHYFLFTTPELTSPFKIIVVGITNNGNRLIETIPPSPINHCADSENIPATFGNCDTFCLVVDQIGNQMEYYTGAKINHDDTEYLSFESFSMTPTGGTGPTNFAYEEFFAPLAGEFRSVKQSFDVTAYNPQCSVRIADKRAQRRAISEVMLLRKHYVLQHAEIQMHICVQHMKLQSANNWASMLGQVLGLQVK